MTVTEEPASSLAGYGEVRSVVQVREVLRVAARGAGLDGLPLVATPVEAPYAKDYDAPPSLPPAAWAGRFDVGRWGILAAWLGGARVGGAAVAWGDPAVAPPHDPDGAVLWDLRVAPAARRGGVGARLFRAAERWARGRGARRLWVETQNVNVPACRFYARQGCILASIDRFAYPDLPHEARLLWVRELGTAP